MILIVLLLLLLAGVSCDKSDPDQIAQSEIREMLYNSFAGFQTARICSKSWIACTRTICTKGW
jgi:hypothetical protein